MEKREVYAYLAGLIASDGHIEQRNNTVSIGTSNIKFVRRISQLLRKTSGNKIRIRRGKTAIAVTVTDRNLVKIFTQKFRIPRGKKSNRLVPPLDLEKKEITQFIKGFADGDSSIHTRKMRGKIVPRIRIMSTSLKILMWIREKLKDEGINSGKIFKDKPHGFGKLICYRLELYGNNVKKFYRRIGYEHPEKRMKIKKFLRLL